MAVWALAAGAACALGGPPTDDAAPTSTSAPETDVPTAREAYAIAHEVALGIDDEAQLASAIGAWTPTIHPANLRAGRTGWTFHFYMPSSGAMAWIVVGRGGSAKLETSEAWDSPPSLLAEQTWRLDSGDALAAAFQQCPAPLDPQQTEGIAQLSLASSNRAIVWDIRLSPGLDPPCRTAIDATTGAIR